MGFPTTLLIPKLNISLIKLKKHNVDNILNYKQSINLYYKTQFHSKYKIDEHILKNLIPKKCSSYQSYQKIRLIIYYNKFQTSNLIISNNTSLSTEYLDRTNVIFMFKCPLGD